MPELLLVAAVRPDGQAVSLDAGDGLDVRLRAEVPLRMVGIGCDAGELLRIEVGRLPKMHWIELRLPPPTVRAELPGGPWDAAGGDVAMWHWLCRACGFHTWTLVAEAPNGCARCCLRAAERGSRGRSS